MTKWGWKSLHATYAAISPGSKGSCYSKRAGLPQDCNRTSWVHGFRRHSTEPRGPPIPVCRIRFTPPDGPNLRDACSILIKLVDYIITGGEHVAKEPGINAAYALL